MVRLRRVGWEWALEPGAVIWYLVVARAARSYLVRSVIAVVGERGGVGVIRIRLSGGRVMGGVRLCEREVGMNDGLGDGACGAWRSVC